MKVKANDISRMEKEKKEIKQRLTFLKELAEKHQRYGK